MTGSSTLMLPLLLLLLVISFCQSSSKPCTSMYEFTRRLNKLNGSKDCGNCSSINITDKCKCLNLTAHIGIFPGYFIRGLESLNHVSHNQEAIRRLKDKLGNMDKNCAGKLNFNSLFVKYDPVISPAVLVQELESVAQQIQNLLSHPTSRRR